MVPRHMFRQAYCLVPDADGVLDDVFELVDSVAGAELPRVGVHGERHIRSGVPAQQEQ